MKLTVAADADNVVNLKCSGTITAFALPSSAEMWQFALGPHGFSRTVLLDLSRTEYMDSSGVSWLIVAHKRFRQEGGRLILHSLPPRLQETVELLRLPDILDIVADESAARGLLQKATP